MIPLHGAWLIDKPEGITSFGVLESLQRAMRARMGMKKSELPSLGHGGTLDPFATGLLVVCVGRAVKLTRWFLGSDKTYIGRIRFGETTVPGDPTDEITEKNGPLPSPRAAQEAAHLFTLNEYHQTPPMHSAKKQGGKPLYELARQGKEVAREAKLCRIHRFELTHFAPPHPSPQSNTPILTADFRADVSAGTYIRVLAQDLGKNLHSHAMLETLRRVASGPKQLQDAIPLHQLLQTIEQQPNPMDWKVSPSWIPFDSILDGLFPEITLSVPEIQELLHGKKGNLQDWAKRGEDSRTPREGHPSVSKNLIVRDEDGNCRAVFEKTEEGFWDVARVFPRDEL
jgi:tRNA pseudouridine55 synthase